LNEKPAENLSNGRENYPFLAGIIFRAYPFLPGITLALRLVDSWQEIVFHLNTFLPGMAPLEWDGRLWVQRGKVAENLSNRRETTHSCQE
jgi:hypothetical protein